MKIKRIFLDNYKLCEKDEADLIIIPANDAPELYYHRKDPYWLVKELNDEVIWSDDLKFAIAVDQDTYNSFVDWWFDNMDEQYKARLFEVADKAIEVGFDLAMSVGKARNRLKLSEKQRRKSNFGKFLLDWVSVGCNRYINKQKSNSIYG